MKKTLLQKAKDRIKKGLRENSTMLGGIQTQQRGGLGIKHSRQYAGKGLRMRRSRSKYSPAQHQHNNNERNEVE